MKLSADAPEALHSCQLSHAARGTPTKFTRSFPANANASENVPRRMTTLKMFTLKKRMSASKKIVKPTKSVRTIEPVFAAIHWIHSGRMKLAPLAPFITRK